MKKMIDWEMISDFELKWWYKKWHIEKDFQAEIFKRLRNLWWICYHVQDIWLWTRFLDWIIVDRWWSSWFIEFKKIKWNTFNISQFEPSQIDLLRDLDKRNPELARVFIYSEKHSKYCVYRFSFLFSMQNDKWGIKVFNF